MDYTATSGTLTFPAGTTSQPVPVTILGDSVYEGSETVLVTLSSPVGAVLADTTGVVTIANDDPEPPIVSIASTSATEGPGASAAFTVSLSWPSSATVSATYTTVGGTAASGLDFTAGTGSVSFPPGSTSQLVSVPVVNDALDEDDEAFTVTLSAPINGTLGTATGTGTIVDDDAPPALSVTGVTVAEGDSGTANAVFPVTLSAASSKTVSVAFATGAGTATTGVDFVAASGPLTFAPGEVSKVVNVAVVGDVLHEAAETFTVTLSAPSAATIATPQATGTITDNDPLPVAVVDTYATPFGVPLVVAAPGVLTNDTNTHGGTMSAELVSGVAHGTLALGANGSVNYTPAAGYAGADSFVYRVVDASGTGNSVSVAITIATAPPPAADVYTTPFQTTLTLAAPGVLGNDGAQLTGVTAELATSVAHGTLTLAANGGLTYTPDAGFAGDDMFTYRTQSAGGLSVPATVTITVTEPGDIQAPQELRVSSIEGNVVTFRWKAPSVGPDPTGYLLEGGLLPSQTLAALDAGHAVPIFTVTAPTGLFYVRVRALGAGGPSGVSNEVLVHVTTAVAPSAPTVLQATASDTTVHLAWTPTFQGGPGTSAVPRRHRPSRDVAVAAGGRAHLVRWRLGWYLHAAGADDQRRRQQDPRRRRSLSPCRAHARPRRSRRRTCSPTLLAARPIWSGIRRRPARLRPAINLGRRHRRAAHRAPVGVRRAAGRHLHDRGPECRRLRRQPAGHTGCYRSVISGSTGEGHQARLRGARCRVEVARPIRR